MIGSSERTPRPIHLLLVDDDDVDVMNVRRACARQHVADEVWVAGDGVEGLAMLRGDELPRDRRLVLLDLDMPRMDGLEMLREIRTDPALERTAVVMLTASTDERDRDEAYRLHVAGYLLKPGSAKGLGELLGALERYWAMAELP